MKFQPRVNPEELETELWYALGFIDAATIMLCGRELIVTSLRDSHEGKQSLHNEGAAVDMRTRDLSDNRRRLLRHFLREHLDPHGFDTVPEPDHIHVEYDPKPGEEFAGKAEA